MENLRARALTILLGLASGVAGTFAARHFTYDPPRTKIAYAGPRDLVPLGPDETIGEKAAAAGPAASELDAAALESIRAERLSVWNRRLKDHELEAYEKFWASPRQQVLERALRSAAPLKGFEYVSVDCKSRTCAATVQWDSYGRALARYTDLLHLSNALHCDREIELPAPVDSAQPYKATILYDCSNQPGS
jgi:hypothetical protein